MKSFPRFDDAVSKEVPRVRKELEKWKNVVKLQ